MQTHHAHQLHHSTADWDFSAENGATWSLDLVEFITAPSSLKISCPVNPVIPTGIMLCNLASTNDLKQGRLVTRKKIVPIAAPGVILFWYGCADDPFTRGRLISLPKPAGWSQSRFTWWDSYDLNNLPKLATRLDAWLAGAWVDGAIVYVDRLTEAVNRCGVGAQSGINTARSIYFDDTEIYSV